MMPSVTFFTLFVFISWSSWLQPSLGYIGVILDSAMSLEQHSGQLIRNSLLQLRNISKL